MVSFSKEGGDSGVVFSLCWLQPPKHYWWLMRNERARWKGKEAKLQNIFEIIWREEEDGEVIIVKRLSGESVKVLPIN